MKKLIAKNVEWWAEKITSPQNNWDNGDQSFTGMLTQHMANKLAQSEREKITPSAIEVFKNHLTGLLEERLAKND